MIVALVMEVTTGLHWSCYSARTAGVTAVAGAKSGW